MTAPQQRRPPSWRMMAGLRRAVRALRYVNDELARANEAIFRPAGAPPSGPPAGTTAGRGTIVAGHRKAAAPEYTGRAA
jgi:hypothetical protein